MSTPDSPDSHDDDAQAMRDDGADAPTRRRFLGLSLAGGAAMASAGTLELTARTQAAEVPAAAARDGDHDTAKPPAFALEELSLSELQAGMKSGRFTARMLVELYLTRIAALDQRGPALNHVLELNPEVLRQAEALDEQRRRRGPRGPLHGIPLLLKDNIDTADKTSTTAGSLALAGAVAARDAFLVSRLREAGALLLGKTNMSEWANFRSTRSSSGWSGRGGQGRNPYALSHNTSGSSSGSAASVAANYCAAAIGTETDGSIVSPASVCGIVGLKPTVGLVSRAGVIPIAHSQDTAGPMTRTVADAALLLGVLAGVDPHDEATRTSRGRGHADYTRFLDPKGLRGARLGLVRSPSFGFSPACDRVLDEAVAVLKAQGAGVEPVELDVPGKLNDAELDVLLYEFKADLNRYLSALAPSVAVHSLAELIAWNERHASEELVYFGQELLVMAEAKGTLETPAYREALAYCREHMRERGIDAALGKHRLDALVALTSGPAWPIDLVSGDRLTGGSSTPAAVAGYPSITVPAGQIFGLPIGISFFGTAFSEPVLLKLAYAFEQATRARKPPRFAATPAVPPAAFFHAKTR